jgi:mono/diheme cytochrome c family protein
MISMRRTITAMLSVFALALLAMKTPPQKGVDKAQMERGLKVYENNCLGCHQADGAGVPSLNPPLVKTKWVLGDKKQLISVVLTGLQEQIEVNGETYANPMPSQAHLSDEDIADVLSYVRNSFGNKANSLTAADVAKVRKTVKIPE